MWRSSPPSRWCAASSAPRSSAWRGFPPALFSGLVGAILHYILTLVGVYLIAFIIDALAPTFGGAKDFNRAFKVAAYAPTASWLAGVFALLPILSVLTILGLY